MNSKKIVLIVAVLIAAVLITLQILNLNATNKVEVQTSMENKAKQESDLNRQKFRDHLMGKDQ